MTKTSLERVGNVPYTQSAPLPGLRAHRVLLVLALKARVKVDVLLCVLPASTNNRLVFASTVMQGNSRRRCRQVSVPRVLREASHQREAPRVYLTVL